MPIRRIRLPLALTFLLLATGLACAGTLIDPMTNPVGYVDQLVTAAHTAWPLAVGLGVYALLELAAMLGKEGGKLAWFATGRVSLVIAGATAVLGATLNMYLGGAPLYPALIAGLAALTTYWHPKAPAAVGIKPAELPRARALLRQSGRVSLALLAVLGLAAMATLSIASCISSSQAKTGGKAAAGCAFSDLLQYGADVKADLAKENFWSALSDAAKQDNLTEEALVCIVQGVVAIEGGNSAGTLATGQPSPVLVHGREFLAKHGKTAAAVIMQTTDPMMLQILVEAYNVPPHSVHAAAWLGRHDACDSANALPAVACPMHYDGCHWACEAL